MSNDLESGLRAALADLTDGPPPPGLAAVAIRTARRQRRTRLAAAGLVAVAALAAAPVAWAVLPAADNPPGTGTPAGGPWPAGPLVVTAYTDYRDTSLVLDYATGEYVEMPYRHVAPSPDGTRAVVRDGDGSWAHPLRVGVLDLATGEVRWIDGLTGGRGAAWSPDGEEILVTETERSTGLQGFAIVDAETLEYRFVDHGDVLAPDVNAAGARYVWAPGGEGIVLATSVDTGTESAPDVSWGVRFYDRSGELQRSLPMPGPVESEAAFSPDGTRMAVRDPYVGGPVTVVDTQTGEVVARVPVRGWSADTWGDIVGWADDDHLLVRSALPGRYEEPPSSRLAVVDLSGRIVEEVDLLGDWPALHIGSSEDLASAGAGFTFGP